MNRLFVLGSPLRAYSGLDSCSLEFQKPSHCRPKSILSSEFNTVNAIAKSLSRSYCHVGATFRFLVTSFSVPLQTLARRQCFPHFLHPEASHQHEDVHGFRSRGSSDALLHTDNRHRALYRKPLVARSRRNHQGGAKGVRVNRILPNHRSRSAAFTANRRPRRCCCLLCPPF